MYDPRKVRDDPLEFVIQMMQADLTEMGEEQMEASLVGLVATKCYAEAFVLALAMERSRGERQAAEQRWSTARRDVLELRTGVADIPPPPDLKGL